MSVSELTITITFYGDHLQENLYSDRFLVEIADAHLPRHVTGRRTITPPVNSARNSILEGDDGADCLTFTTTAEDN